MTQTSINSIKGLGTELECGISLHINEANQNTTARFLKIELLL